VDARGLDTNDIPQLLERYGHNKFEIKLPAFSELYIEGLLAPFSVFQVSLCAPFDLVLIQK
jgi:manganese-transporting P-type ATPase